MGGVGALAGGWGCSVSRQHRAVGAGGLAEGDEAGGGAAAKGAPGCQRPSLGGVLPFCPRGGRSDSECFPADNSLHTSELLPAQRALVGAGRSSEGRLRRKDQEGGDDDTDASDNGSCSF